MNVHGRRRVDAYIKNHATTSILRRVNHFGFTDIPSCNKLETHHRRSPSTPPAWRMERGRHLPCPGYDTRW